jgi:hypothetical protein
MKKYIVYDCAQHEHHHCETEEEATRLLHELVTEDSQTDGLSTDHLGSFISVQSHKVEFEKTDEVENYPCPHHNDFCSGPHDEECPEDCDGEEWPHSNEFDHVCEVHVISIENKDIDKHLDLKADENKRRMIEEARGDEVCCGARGCEYWDTKAEQYCNGDKNGSPAVADCVLYFPIEL